MRTAIIVMVKHVSGCYMCGSQLWSYIQSHIRLLTATIQEELAVNICYAYM